MIPYVRWLVVVILIGVAAWRLLPDFSSLPELFKYKDNILLPWLAIAVFSQTGQYIGSSWLSQVLLKIAGFRINFKNTLLISCLNVFAAHILPVGDAGMIAATFFFYRKLGVPATNIIFLALLWPIFGGIVLLTLFLTSLFFLPMTPNLSFQPSFVSLTVINILTIIGIIIFWKRKTVIRKLTVFLLKFPAFHEIVKFKHNLPVYRKSFLRNKLYVAEALIAAVLYYVSNILTLIFSFIAFGSLPPLSVIIFAYVLSLLAGWVTLAPAGIGAAEATLILVFLHFNVDATLSLATVLVFRLITFWLPIPFGALAFRILMKKDKK